MPLVFHEKKKRQNDGNASKPLWKMCVGGKSVAKKEQELDKPGKVPRDSLKASS
jgi:hypothetical protein